MRVTLQRVKYARVRVRDELVGTIEEGLMVLVGFGDMDEVDVLDTAIRKILELRIFSDAAGKMNLSLLDTKGAILAISQFTLYANCSRGRRPDFTHAAPPQKARELFDLFVAKIRQQGIPIQTGIFAEDMQVELLNDGPVTINLEF
ncbi:MAG: D-tyrosyl-tRNA(Tyr) deacylase [Candidatus Cloacimonetes bacterium]|nr:D-tyrosyl-tRNA(Tyr) deacylase [Candidatus Cloacimonadota bacterium]